FGFYLFVLALFGMIAVPLVVAWWLHVSQELVPDVVLADENATKRHHRAERLRKYHHASFANHCHTLGQIVFARYEIERDLFQIRQVLWKCVRGVFEGTVVLVRREFFVAAEM